MATKMIRRYAMAKGIASAGVLISASSRSVIRIPNRLTPIATSAKNVALVPTTRFAASWRWAPKYWAMRMVEAIDTPKTAPIRRNVTMFEIDVAVSAASPRYLPTQTEFTVEFND